MKYMSHLGGWRLAMELLKQSSRAKHKLAILQYFVAPSFTIYGEIHPWKHCTSFKTLIGFLNDINLISHIHAPQVNWRTPSAGETMVGDESVLEVVYNMARIQGYGRMTHKIILHS